LRRETLEQAFSSMISGDLEKEGSGTTRVLSGDTFICNDAPYSQGELLLKLCSAAIEQFQACKATTNGYRDGSHKIVAAHYNSERPSRSQFDGCGISSGLASKHKPRILHFSMAGKS
jgi:hypothetical protein